MIQLITTRRCDFSCAHCMLSCKSAGKHMSLDVFAAAMPYIKKAGYTYLFGGEPSLHPEFRFILTETAKNAGNIRLVTNGGWIKSAPMAEKFADALKIASIIIGPENILLRISNDRWHRKHMRYKDIKTAAAYIEGRISGLKAHCEPMDDAVIYPLGRALSGDAKKLLRSNSFHKEPAECTKTAYNVWDNLSIDVNGNVAPCPHHQAVIGNIVWDTMPDVIGEAEAFMSKITARNPKNKDCRYCRKIGSKK